MRVIIDPHCRRRMRERSIGPEDMALAWTTFEGDRPSREHPGARVRTGRRLDGSRVTVVAQESKDVLRFITVW